MKRQTEIEENVKAHPQGVEIIVTDERKASIHGPECDMCREVHMDRFSLLISPPVNQVKMKSYQYPDEYRWGWLCDSCLLDAARNPMTVLVIPDNWPDWFLTGELPKSDGKGKIGWKFMETDQTGEKPHFVFTRP